MPMFHNFDDGRPKMKRDAAVRLIKTAMPDLARRACEEGWQTGLLDFVQYQHGKPNGAAISMIIENHYKADGHLAKVEKGTKLFESVRKIADAREDLKAELLAAVEMKLAS